MSLLLYLVFFKVPKSAHFCNSSVFYSSITLVYKKPFFILLFFKHQETMAFAHAAKVNC